MSEAPTDPRYSPTPSEFDVDRKVKIRRGMTSDLELSVSKNWLDIMCEGIRQMPDPGRVIQPISFLLLGVALTTGVEAYNATPGSEPRHTYAAIAACGVLAGLVCLFADRHVRRQGHKHAQWLDQHMDALYAEHGMEPPPKKLGWWKRVQVEGAAKRAQEATATGSQQAPQTKESPRE